MLRLVCVRSPLKSAAVRDFSSTTARCARTRARVENIPASRVKVQETVGQKAARYDGYGRTFLGVACGVGLGGLCYYGLSMPHDAALNRSIVWPQYVRQRLRSTFGYFGVGLAATAGTVVALHRGSMAMRLMQVMQRHPVMSMIVPLGGLMATSAVVRSASDTPTKVTFYLATNALIGGIICPLGFLGGPLLMRAAMITGGALGALSLTAMCAPSKQFMNYSAPLSMALGGLCIVTLGGAFLPAGTALAAGINSLYIYGGLVLFGGLTIYDVQRMVARAEGSTHYDPVSESLSIYMDAVNIFIRVAMMLAGNQKRR